MAYVWNPDDLIPRDTVPDERGQCPDFLPDLTVVRRPAPVFWKPRDAPDEPRRSRAEMVAHRKRAREATKTLKDPKQPTKRDREEEGEKEKLPPTGQEEVAGGEEKGFDEMAFEAQVPAPKKQKKSEESS